MVPSLPGLIQALSIFGVAILLARPLGGYIRKVMEGERVFLSPVIRPVERGVYKVIGVSEQAEQGWKAYALSVILFSFVCILALYLQQRLQTYLPLNQGGVPGHRPRRARPLLQHVGQLRHQHELAELRRRDDDDVPDPDGRARRPQLHFRRVRYRGGTGPDSRPDPQVGHDARQLLGRHDPQHALHPVADRLRLCAVPRLPGRDPDLRQLSRHPHAPGRNPDDPPRSCCLPGSHQGAR